MERRKKASTRQHTKNIAHKNKEFGINTPGGLSTTGSLSTLRMGVPSSASGAAKAAAVMLSASWEASGEAIEESAMASCKNA
jgi:hypothetical protein